MSIPSFLTAGTTILGGSLPSLMGIRIVTGKESVVSRPSEDVSAVLAEFEAGLMDVEDLSVPKTPSG